MANNPTTNKQLNRPDYNDQNWNTPLNNDFTIIDQCFGSTIQPSNVSNVYTVGSTDIQNMRINLTGTLTANAYVTVPPTYGGFWIVSNNTTGSYTLNMKVTTGSNYIPIQQGYSTIIYSNGVECFEAVSQKFNVTGGTVSGNLSITGGLNVNGSAMYFNAGSGQLYVAGSIYATGNITAFSDERIKSNVSNIDNAIKNFEQFFKDLKKKKS